jgi:acylphosphatase
MDRTISIRVSGKVQGVFFRQSTREKAMQLGITGMVQNERDGSVRILATGPDEFLDKFIEWCSHGPPHAVVTEIKVHDEEPAVFKNFLIQRW